MPMMKMVDFLKNKIIQR